MRMLLSVLSERLRLIGKDCRGSMLPVLAFAMVVGVGSAALGVDLVRARALQQNLRLAADAAALAAAARLPDADGARKAALVYVEKNMPAKEFGNVLNAADVEMGTWDSKTHAFTPSANQRSVAESNAVRVTARLSSANGNAVTAHFATIFGIKTMDVSVQATAGRGGPPCVIVLEPTASRSVELGYGSAVDTTGCGAQINSTGKTALKIASGASLKSADICVGGTADIKGSAYPAPREYCPGQTDPMASLTPPSYGGCDYNKSVFNASSATLLPGVYCGGLMIEGNSDVTLSPGVYVMENGPFAVLDTSIVSGTGVMIYFTGKKASINFNDESQVNLTAAEAGPYKGVLVFQDREFSNKHAWNGNSTVMTGVVYVPTSELTAYSNHLITPKDSCTVVISKILNFNSGAGVSINLSSSKCRDSLPSPYGRGVTLLE